MTNDDATNRLRQARNPRDLIGVRVRFSEFAAAVDEPRCCVEYEAEIAMQPGARPPLGGQLGLAIDAGDAAACVAPPRVDVA